jgi:hypothetical protein
MKKEAYFKENLKPYEVDFLCAINPRNEIIFNLISKQSLASNPLTKSLTDGSNLIECRCNGLCKYTKSNLNILFYHK